MDVNGTNNNTALGEINSELNYKQVKGLVKKLSSAIYYSDISYDEKVLYRLHELCLEKDFTIETAMMLRNLALHKFQQNKTAEAIDSMQSALRLLEGRKRDKLRIAYLSELGLFYFYECQYEMAKETFENAFTALIRTSRPKREVLFYLYYRSGILSSYMQEYEKADSQLKHALFLSFNAVERGKTLMNIGVNYKRQCKYSDSLVYYQFALRVYKNEHIIEKSGVYNNIAELYKTTGEYDKALLNIMEAFRLLESRNMNMYFVFFQTYAEIKLMQGEEPEILYKLLELINEAKELFNYKCFLIGSLKVFGKVKPQEKEQVQKLHKELNDLIASVGGSNEEFRSQLITCLSEINLTLNAISSA